MTCERTGIITGKFRKSKSETDPKEQHPVRYEFIEYQNK